VLTTQNARAVAQVCARLDGIPLAIELAAARVGSLAVEGIAARLDDRFRLLVGGARDALPRQRTLRATLDWSYDLLSQGEQRLLDRLSVFAGGWALEAVEAICAGPSIEAWEVLDLLGGLVNKSLVLLDEAGTEGEQGRYRLLETVRQYGWERLAASGESAEVRDRHLSWYLALAEEAEPELRGPEQGAWLDRLDREHDNLRAALRWVLDCGLSTLGLQVVGGIWKFWLRRGYQREGRRWLAALLALPADDDDATTVARATALEGAAWLAQQNFDFAQASALFAQSGALRRAAGQEERTAGLLISAATAARASGDYTRATALLEECLAENRRLGRRGSSMYGGLELSLALLAMVMREQGKYARATALCEECLSLNRELADAEGIADALLKMADLARDQGETRQARALSEESLARFQELGHPRQIAFSLNNLAQAAYLDGDLAEAASRAEKSATIFRGMQAESCLAEVLITLGQVRGAQEQASVAHAHLTEALTLARAAGPRLFVATALEALGAQAVWQAEVQHGVQLLAAAARLRRVMGTPVRPADRPVIEAALAHARVSLDDVAFEAAWAAGETLPLEQIVASAGASA
jgi:non-specific serine/threonine protein kinase